MPFILIVVVVVVVVGVVAVVDVIVEQKIHQNLNRLWIRFIYAMAHNSNRNCVYTINIRNLPFMLMITHARTHIYINAIEN